MANEPPTTVEENDNAPDAWPKEFTTDDGATFSVYQPQFTAWDGLQLSGTSAVVVQSNSDAPKTYGSVALAIKTNTDAAKQTVYFEQIGVTQINFPSAKDKAAEWGAEVARRLSQMMPSVGLDKLQENLDIASASRAASFAGLRNEPPQIIFSEKPALNITLDGDAQWRPLGDTSLQRAINTRVLLVRDGSRYLLHLWDGYIEAPSLNGPWKVAENVPANLTSAEQQLAASEQVDLLADEADDGDDEVASLKTTPVPDIYVNTKPAELVVSEGALQWTPVADTQLLGASNTNAYLFKDIASQNSYILVSGRWFKSGESLSNWQYVSADKLPADFARIPDNSPQEAVKAAVAGTEQAEEAAIANTVPEVVRVERTVTQMDNAPVYDNGQPQLAPVDNTSLYYVLNSTTPVIKVGGDTWFACENGVWFTSYSAFGPWRVAVHVPVEIYKIPLESPLHYVTYVRIQRYDSNYVWFYYTPGYYGTIVSSQGTVVYGTGYYYPSYVGTTVYVSYPVSYGFCYNPCWTPWRGWYFGFSSGWVWSSWNYYRCRPLPPCWGPYRGHHYRPRYAHVAPRPNHRHITHPRINFQQSDPRRGVSRPPRFAAGTRYNSHTGRPVAVRPVSYDRKVAEVRARRDRSANLGRPMQNESRSTRFTQGNPVRGGARAQDPATFQRTGTRPARTYAPPTKGTFRPLSEPGTATRVRPERTARPDTGRERTFSRSESERRARPVTEKQTEPNVSPRPTPSQNPVREPRPQRERPSAVTPERKQTPPAVTPERTRPAARPVEQDQRPAQGRREQSSGQERSARPAVQERSRTSQDRQTRSTVAPERRQSAREVSPGRTAPSRPVQRPSTPPVQRPSTPPVQRSTPPPAQVRREAPRSAPVQRSSPPPAPTPRSAPSSAPSRDSSSDKDKNPGSGRPSRGR
jgi:hypothetical protein